MNKTLLKELKKATNYTYTENGGLTHKSTLNKCYDLFAFGGASRGKSEEDILDMFYDASNLIGGNGTKYNEYNVDKEYARVDGGTSSPGYFTLKSNQHFDTNDKTNL